MRAYSTAYKSHLAERTQTQAQLCKITRTDGTVIRSTNHDEDIIVDGNTYKSTNGYQATALSSSASLDSDTLEMAGGYKVTGISRNDLDAGLYDHAQIEIYSCNYESPTEELEIKGWLGKVTLKDNGYEADFISLSAKLKQNILKIYTPGCNADLGDSRCGVNLDNYRETGTVTAVTSNSSFTANVTNANGHTIVANWFAFGLITWTGGLNDGLKSHVKSSTLLGVLGLYLDTPYTIAIGDTFSIAPGCNKSLDPTTGHCKTKYDNMDEGRAFRDIPGRKKVFSVRG